MWLTYIHDSTPLTIWSMVVLVERHDNLTIAYMNSSMAVVFNPQFASIEGQALIPFGYTVTLVNESISCNNFPAPVVPVNSHSLRLLWLLMLLLSLLLGTLWMRLDQISVIVSCIWNHRQDWWNLLMIVFIVVIVNANAKVKIHVVIFKVVN